MRGQSGSTLPAGLNPQWVNAMGSLCRISDISKHAALELVAPDDEIRPAVIEQVWDLRHRSYSKLYPEVQRVDNDPYDDTSCVIYTQNAGGQVTSTARMAFDGALGIPEAELAGELVSRYHNAGIQYAELGRFVIGDEARGVLPNYYRAFYELGLAWGLDLFLMFVPEKKIDLYRLLMDAEVVLRFEGLTFGSAHNYVAMEWWLHKTRPKFFRWSHAQPAHASRPTKEEPV